MDQEPTPPPANDDPFESIANFFDSGLWSAISLLLQVFVVLLWLALAWWTYQDARRRVEVPAYIAGAVALSVLIPFLGALIWLIIRPPEYLDEARERELELLALERRMSELGDEEGREIVGRMLDREGVTPEPEALQRALRQAGVASEETVRELEVRLTELEFRLRMLDGPPAPRDDGGEGDERRRRAREERRRRRRELPEITEAGETGRVPRWRRPGTDPEAYD